MPFVLKATIRDLNIENIIAVGGDVAQRQLAFHCKDGTMLEVTKTEWNPNAGTTFYTKSVFEDVKKLWKLERTLRRENIPYTVKTVKK